MRGTIYILCFFLISCAAFAQKDRMDKFFVGYIGASGPNPFLSHYVVTVVDTGLVFSDQFLCLYDLSGSSFTYNNAQGFSQLLWQGCYLLDARTMNPIENGDYRQSLGGEFCDQNLDFFPGTISNDYNSRNDDFMLSRAEDEVYLIFARYNSPLEPLSQMELYYSVIRYDTSKQSWYVYSKYNKISEGISPVYEVMQPIRHANGIDWWIIAGERNTNKWYTFLLDQNGIHLAQTSILEGWEDNNILGNIDASPDGQTIVYHKMSVSGDNESWFFVADFNRCTGAITYRQSASFPISELDSPGYWAIISPNGRFAYISNSNSIYQYDLLDNNIKASRIKVASWDWDLQKTKYPESIGGGFERPFRANNGRIYHWAGNSMPLISKIEYPDKKGPDVGFVQDYVRTPIFLPWKVQKFPDYGMAALPEPCPTNKNKETGAIQLSVFPNPVTSIIYLSGYPEGDNKRSQIIDNLGRVVWQGDTDSLNRGLEVSRLAAGVYVLSIDGLGVKKFVKV